MFIYWRIKHFFKFNKFLNIKLKSCELDFESSRIVTQI